MGGGGSKNKKGDSVVKATNTYTTSGIPNNQPAIQNPQQKQN